MRKACITLLGLGYLPVVPGTWGSGGAVLVWGCAWWAVAAAGAPQWWLDVLVAGLIVLGSIGSVVWGDWAVAFFESKDPKPFVLDEAVGQWVSLLLLPVPSAAAAWAVAAVQFVAFRVFDILKPPPARQLEHLPAGWGILADDLMSAVYANLVGQVLFRWVWVFT